MKYIRHYESVTVKNKDLTRPVVSMTNNDTATLNYDHDLRLLESSSFKITAKSTAPNNVNFLYSYTLEYPHRFITYNSGSVSNATIGVKFQNTDTLIVGTYNYSGHQYLTDKTFSSPDLGYKYYLKEPSGQGSSGMVQTFYFYTNLDLPVNSTITYEIYAE